MKASFSKRMIRVNEEIKKELINIIREEVKDPRINEFINIVKVETTKDLKHCTVYVSSFGVNDDKNEMLNGLGNAVGYIRKSLAKRLNLRNTPEIKFKWDDSIEYGIHMSKLLKTIKSDESSEE